MDFEQAEQYLAWLERSKSIMRRALNTVTGKRCPMWVSASEYDAAIQTIMEQLEFNMFYEQVKEAREIIDNSERREIADHQLQESTFYVPMRAS